MMREKIKAHVSTLEQELISVRRDLHRHPERGFKEFRTSQLIHTWLKACDFDAVESLVGTGVLGVLHGRGPGPTIAVRVDIDALNISDQKDVEYKSVNPGLMHACGHDVHTTIGLGVAKVMSTLRDAFAGNVKMIFQASEEFPWQAEGAELDVYTEYPVGKRGADLAVEAGALKNPQVDRLIGIHCWPSLEVGRVGYQYGPAMAGTGNFHIAVLGRGGHAATPHKTVDSIPVAAQVVLALQTVISRKIDPTLQLVLTIGTIKGGIRRSIITDRVDLTGTVRGFDPQLMATFIPEQMENLIRGITSGSGADYIFEYGLDQPPVINDTQVVTETAASLKEYLGNYATELSDAPMTGEDFSFMSREVPSVYLKLGTHNDQASTCFPLHNPNFDIDERAIAVGVGSIVQVIVDYLAEHAT